MFYHCSQETFFMISIPSVFYLFCFIWFLYVNMQVFCKKYSCVCKYWTNSLFLNKHSFEVCFFLINMTILDFNYTENSYRPYIIKRSRIDKVFLYISGNLLLLSEIPHPLNEELKGIPWNSNIFKLKGLWSNDNNLNINFNPYYIRHKNNLYSI